MAKRAARLTARHDTLQDIYASADKRQSTFDPSASPLFNQVGFVVGAPRSGTTWLQQLLLVHPLITTGGESHVFCEGLPEIFINFGYRDAASHLSSWVTEPELVTASREFCDTVFETQRRATRPDAQLILEKTPQHRPGQSALQARVYPDGRYVHIVRDGRDSAASQRTLWGKTSSEYSSASRVASGWADAVRSVRDAFSELAYIELRYEDVVADTPKALATIFDHFNLPYDDALCEAAAKFGKSPVNTGPSSIDTGVRKHRGDVLAERGVARAAGDLLVELGYADEAEVKRMAKQVNRDTVVSDVRDAVANSVDWAKHEWVDVRFRLRRRKKRNALRPSHDVGKAITEALADKNAAALARVLSPSVKFDGVPTPAEDVAKALVERFAGFRITGRGTQPGFVQLTAVAEDGQRDLLRVELKGSTAVSVDTRRGS